MKHYYSAESAMGSSSSMGFCNDQVVKVWDSRKERDKYVKECPNISCKKIKRSQVITYARNGRNIKPYSYKHYFIKEKEDNDLNNYIGTIEIGGEDNYGYIERFNKDYKVY